MSDRDELLGLPDYLAECDLLALGIEADTVAWLLRRTPLTGHDGRPVVERDRLPDLLAEREREDRR
jgi:hypothetical protein